MKLAVLVVLALLFGGIGARSQQDSGKVKPDAPAVTLTPYGFLGVGAAGSKDTLKLVSPPNWAGLSVETSIGVGALVEWNIGAPEWTPRPLVYPRDRYVRYRTPDKKWSVYGGVYDRLWSYTNVRYLSIGDIRTVIHPGFRTPHVELVRTLPDLELTAGVWDDYFSVAASGREGPLRFAATFTALKGDPWWKVSAQYTVDSLVATVLYERAVDVKRSTLATHIALNQEDFSIIASGGWRKPDAGKAVGFAVAELDWNLFKSNWDDLVGPIGPFKLKQRQQLQILPFIAVGYGNGVTLFRSLLGLNEFAGQAGVKIRF